MSAPALPQRLPSAIGTPRKVEVYRVPVRWPDGNLAYNATHDQEAELLAAGAVTPVRSPSGVLRYLRLNRDWRLLRADSKLCKIITRHLQSGMGWEQQAAKAKTGRFASVQTLHFH